MKTIKALVLMTAAVLALGPAVMPAPAVAVPTPQGIDSRLRLDWEAGTKRNGKPVIQGYLYNDYGRPASDIHLLVETLDASGAVIARTIGFVQGVVQFNDRVYFEVPLKAPGASYRVSVTSFDWKGGGGGAM
ncbi:MAG TPA: hypothetical protein VKJ67_17215 [Methylomirabilota bacterium]|nr:hypothetical protein [Methylomirabilota bacterium]